MNATDTLMTSAVSHMSHIPLDTLGTWFKVLVWGHLAIGAGLVVAVFWKLWKLWKQWRKQHGRR